MCPIVPILEALEISVRIDSIRINSIREKLREIEAVLTKKKTRCDYFTDFLWFGVDVIIRVAAFSLGTIFAHQYKGTIENLLDPNNFFMLW